MALTYLLLSLLVSGLSEFVSSLLSLRSKNLYQAIGRLLGDSTKADELYANARIKSLYTPNLFKTGETKPSYIPAKAFAEALLHDIEPATDQGSMVLAEFFRDVNAQGKASMTGFSNNEDFRNSLGVPTADEIQTIASDTAITSVDQLKIRIQAIQSRREMNRILMLVNKLSDDKNRQLQMLVNGATARAVDIREEIEDWFNEMMDRASGWYKQKIMYLNIAFSLVVAFALNADSIRMANELSNDPTKRQALVASAENTITNLKLEGDVVDVPASQPPKQVQSGDVGDEGADEGNDDAEEPTVKSGLTPEDAQKKLELIIHQIENDKLPIGWADEDDIKNAWDWVEKLLGLAFTSIAISLGAPFWFNLLQDMLRVHRKIATDDDDNEEKK